MDDSMHGMDSTYVIARVDPKEKERFTGAAERLKVNVSDMIISTMRIVSGEVLGGSWECRRVHLSGNSILAIGEEPPTLGGGLPVPVTSCKIVAPASFWKVLERSLLDRS
jgi:hypothetical protein